jgi:hypothetical protein
MVETLLNKIILFNRIQLLFLILKLSFEKRFFDVEIIDGHFLVDDITLFIQELPQLVEAAWKDVADVVALNAQHRDVHLGPGYCLHGLYNNDVTQLIPKSNFSVGL